MKSTCVSMNCPFISLCKDYSLTADRSKGCKTQQKFIDAAKMYEAGLKATRQPNPNYVPPPSVRRDK